MSPKRLSAREKLKRHFLANLGRVMHTSELRDVAGIIDFQRRIRELRREEGLNILTHNDRVDLKPGEHLLESAEPIPTFGRGISSSQRARILARNGFTCQICGRGPGDPDPLDPTRTVKLHVDHIRPLSAGGTNEDDNLRVTCSACNEGRSNLDAPLEERAINLLGMIRRAPRDVQREVYEALKRKFERGQEGS